VLPENLSDDDRAVVMSIASLLAADPDGLSGKEAALGLQAFDRVHARLDGQRAGYVARFDESMHWATVGSRNAASWLASHTDMATTAAQSVVRPRGTWHRCPSPRRRRSAGSCRG
jgi:hypothetical protein